MAEYVADVKAIKKRMIDCDLEKIVALSEASGIDRNTLSAVLNKGKQPSEKVIKALMKTLCITEGEAGKIFFNSNLHSA
jgi:lambda repressor-like predicted transcriptional regulator